jgi:D-alanyl-D-alanine carboxypeptidase
MSFQKWDLRLAVKVVPIVPAVMLLASAVLLFTAREADARRRYYRERYTPAAAAMAIDVNTGRILYSKNANEPRYPASLTKVMTLYLLFDALRDGKLTMRTELKVSAAAAAQSPTKLGLSEGAKIAVADAIGAIVTKSANDMAVSIAEAIAGSEEEFARLMTQKARTIGMLNTTFRNASGLPDPDQKTTAQDLIILGKSMLADHPERCKVFATKYFQYNGQVFQNHNTLLFSYAGMEGMKTGYTSSSGFNLIATAKRGDKRVLAVVLGSQSAGSRNATMRTILDGSWPQAFTQVAARKIAIQVAAIQPETVKHDHPEMLAKRQIVQVKPVGAAALSRKPDRTSISILIASIESGLVTKPRLHISSEPAAVASDMATDEPEEKAGVSSRSLAYASPPPRDIARNETLVAQALPARIQNISVHYKSEGQPDVMPLAAISLDGAPEPPPVKPAQVIRTVEKEEAKPPQTLSAATIAVSREMDQPGPFHVQVGAFEDKAEAQQRLESAKQALGEALAKAHPEFIMPVSLPTGVTMFRARLSRFADEAQAKSACIRLKSSGIDCWDMRAQ